MQSNEFRLEGHIISCLGIFGRTYPTHKLSVNTPFAIMSLLHLLHEGLRCLTNRSLRHSVLQPWKKLPPSFFQRHERSPWTTCSSLWHPLPQHHEFQSLFFFDFADNFASHLFWARAIFSNPKISRLHDRVVPLRSDKLHCFLRRVKAC